MSKAFKCNYCKKFKDERAEKKIIVLTEYGNTDSTYDLCGGCEAIVCSLLAKILKDN